MSKNAKKKKKKKSKKKKNNNKKQQNMKTNKKKNNNKNVFLPVAIMTRARRVSLSPVLEVRNSVASRMQRVCNATCKSYFLIVCTTLMHGPVSVYDVCVLCLFSQVLCVKCEESFYGT